MEAHQLKHQKPSLENIIETKIRYIEQREVQKQG